MSNASPSPLCFGCEALGGTDWGDVDIAAIERAIEEAMDIGVNFFDTATVYGLTSSEERLARALGHRRHDAVIATKGGLSWQADDSGRAKVWKDSSPDAIVNGVHESLTRMQLDVIPVYYIHWPDPNTPFEATFSTLQNLKEQGKIAAIGCSNFSIDQLREAANYADVDYVQGPLNLFKENRNREMLRHCEEHSMAFVAYGALASGLLTGKYHGGSTFGKNDRRSRLDSFSGDGLSSKLAEMERYQAAAAEQNLSLVEYALRWVLDQPSVLSVITGIKSCEQLRQNWQAIAGE